MESFRSSQDALIHLAIIHLLSHQAVSTDTRATIVNSTPTSYSYSNHMHAFTLHASYQAALLVLAVVSRGLTTSMSLSSSSSSSSSLA